MKTLKALAITFLLVMAGGVTSAKDESAEAIKAALSKVPTAGVPAKAADLVAEVKPDSRKAVAAEVVKAAIKSERAPALAVVKAVSQKSPEVAPTVAATAAELQPQQAAQVAQAAAAAAPVKAVEVVKAIAQVLPKAHREVALAVAQVAPDSAQEILAGIPVSASIAASEPGTPAVTNGSSVPRISGPFVPLSTTPGNVPPGSGQVPAGGRDLARP